eukprot:scaffold41057_cov191-Amphora_coffeaeformis.AAC.1
MEESQCIADSRLIAQDLADQNAYFTVGTNCTDRVTRIFCEGDAADHFWYDNFVRACATLYGQLHTYDLECVTVTADGGRVTARWNNMVSCFAPVCATDDVRTALSECFTNSGVLIGDLVGKQCKMQDVRRAADDLLIEDTITGECGSGAMTLTDLTALSMALLSVLAWLL